MPQPEGVDSWEKAQSFDVMSFSYRVMAGKCFLKRGVCVRGEGID